MDARSDEHFCVADVEFEEDLWAKYPGMDKGNSVTFGTKAFAFSLLSNSSTI